MQLKLQSAMEYLMTYGWAILIIAVVLAALFQLGVFNPNSFTPKAHAGSCQVIRPYGPGNTNYISLAGTCNNQLPQYVGQFSGTNSYIDIGNLAGTENAWSIVLWTSTTTLNPVVQYPIGFNGISNHAGVFIGDVNDCGQTACIGVYDGANVVLGSSTKINTWYNIAVSKSGTGYSLYINGAHINTGIMSNLPLSQVFLAFRPDLVLPLHGTLANVQIYNNSLSANDISTLYDEGIGGAPIDLFHLVGWWPLNGNANDYSGNKINGIESNVVYSGSWASTYAAP